MRQKAKRQRKSAYGVLPLLAVLLIIGAFSAVLDVPHAWAFPQTNTADVELSHDGIGDMIVLDINGDQYPDLIVSSQIDLTGRFGHIAVYLGQSPLGGYPSSPDLLIGTPTHKRLIVNDVNVDGRLDLAILTHRPEKIQVYYQPGNISIFNDPFSWSVSTLDTLSAFDLAAGALINVTSQHDLAALYPDGLRIYENSTNPIRFIKLSESVGYNSVRVLDVDGDLSDDVVLARPSDIKIFFGRDGQISSSCVDPDCITIDVFPGVNGVTSLLMEDVTSDGLSDFVFGVSNPFTRKGAVVILARDGSDPTFRTFEEVFTTVGNFTGELTLGDFNKDGRTDIAAILYTGGNIAFFHQREDGSFESHADLQLIGTSYIGSGSDERIVKLDYNGDGYDDIALGSNSTRSPVIQQGKISMFLQEDQPVSLDQPIPNQCPHDCFYLNQDNFGNNLINLSHYFSDDHGPIIYNVTSFDSENLTAFLDSDGYNLDFRPKPGWFGIARFQVSANDLYPNHIPTMSNIFSVMVNAAPMIVGSPPESVSQDDEYNYVINVEDPYPADDWHTFLLVQAPPEASLDVNSGLLRWQPTSPGNFSFTVQAIDSYGASSQEKMFTVEVFVPPEEPPETGLPIPRDALGIAVFGTILITIFLISALISFNENVKYGALLLLIPLYSKIKREKVLDHFIRGQIYGYIMANPGEHYNSIKQALDITNGSLAHHLKTLERERFIKSKRFGLYRRFYPWTMRIPEDGYFRLNEIQKNILDLCRHQPGITQKDLALSLNLTPPTINYHIAILAEHGHVSVIRRGRKTHVYMIKGGAK